MVEFIKSKKEMSEEDIKANFITPAIVSKGWKNGEHIAYEEYFTDGRIEVRGDKARRKEGKKSDYSLYYQFGTRIAIVEAKDNKHSVRAGLQQAIEYGEILDVPFVYSSNGDGFIEHDRITREERELELDEFPTREELFSRMTKEKGLTYEITEAISTPYYTDAFSMKTPRYYQQIAINRTIETVARGQKRVMFVMATGTGKTFMAFQIIHRLRKAGLAKRVLFLADGEILDVPFVYSSNGDGFIEHDRITREERELELDEFPTREELFSRMTKEKGLTYEITEAISTPYYTDAFSMKTPRYYQQIAINRTIETVARGQKRVMFVMATGTGKTFMAFQIIHRLRKAGLAKRVLFLADRNILVDQTMAEDFRPFEKVMTKITPKLLTAPEKLNSFEIYLGLYQQLTGEDGTETHYQKFDKDFFDLIVIDEAHRGSAKEDSNWRKVIDYFSSATQIGMTATPKETKNASNTEYFGEPIYTYSLKQGIEDGFLAPYRVMRVNLDVDVDGYRPETGKVDANGQLIEDRYYGRKDFDKTIVIDDRTQRVAKFVSDYMKQNNARFDKTIVFCVDIDHAERMRAALVKENLDLVQEDYRYVMQVTGDNAEGKAQLDNFMDVNSNFPAIVTTSKLLTTGVNAKTCRLIVLDSNIQSMTEFKQIIGRGTRLYPQKGKEFFTIIDFRNVTNLFADPDFDGEPVKVLETGAKTVSGSTPGFVGEEGDPVEKYIVTDKQVTILNSTVQVLDENGKLITESLTDYTRKNILGSYATLNDFITVWHTADKKKLILDELYKKGVYLDAIRESEGISEQEIDDFDLLLKLAYGQKELTKTERINKLKQSGYLYKYSEEARAVLEILLNKYMDKGIGELESIETLKLPEFQIYGGTFKIINTYFGDKKRYLQAIKELEQELFTVA
ncbi:type I restriction-modification system, R subunit [Streptococcus pneumoniae]|nr:type I restriction-modification system, R subunit [Streptococcus pneumoniae]